MRKANFAPVLPESLGDGAPHADVFRPESSVLPLFGFDFTAKRDLATLELTSADTPALPGTHVRLEFGIGGDRSRPPDITYNGQVIHVDEAGLVGTTVLFGAGPTIVPTTQGALPFSTLFAQRITMGGLEFDVLHRPIR